MVARVFPVLLVLLVGAAARAGAVDLQATWTQMGRVPGPPAGPMGSSWLRIAYDSVNRKTVLIGGSGSTYGNDVHLYDAGTDTWLQLEPFVDCPGIVGFTPPAKRDEHVVDYDPVNHLYWMYGGSGFNCSGPNRTAGPGSTAGEILDATLSATEVDAYKDWTVNAGGKKSYVSAYDPARRALTLATPVTGLGPGTSYRLYPQRGGGTWFYAPATGTWASLDGPVWGYTGPNPVNRLSPAFAYSAADRAMVMFGGSTLGDTWALDVQTRSWVQMLPNNAPGAPAPRGQIENSMVYDEAHDVFILFGGLCKSTAGCGAYGAELNDTWAYHLPTNTWTRLNPPLSPSPRQQHQMAYDPVNRVTVLFGGRQGDTRYNDLWVFDYAARAWTKIVAPNPPPPINLGSMTYDREARVLVLYKSHNVWLLRLEGREPGDPDAPVLTSLTPASAPQGSGDLLLTVRGANFLSDTAVTWNGSPRPTTLLGPTEVQATIAAADLAQAGTAQVAVRNGGAGGPVSNALPFSITPPSGKDLVVQDLAASPDSAEVGASTTVTYRVRNLGTVTVTETYRERLYLSSDPVLDPGDLLLAETTGHTADLAPGASLSLTQSLVLPTSAPPGPAYLLVTADAAQAVAENDEGNNVAAIPFTVSPAPAGQIVMDNAPAGVQDAAGGRTFTGKWCKSGSGGAYGPDSLYSCGSGLDLYRFTPPLTEPVTFDVYVRWTAHYKRSTMVPVTVTHTGGAATLTFNQQVGGNQWHLHGRYTLGPGAGSVEISDANGQAAADAVRFTPAP